MDFWFICRSVDSFVDSNFFVAGGWILLLLLKGGYFSCLGMNKIEDFFLKISRIPYFQIIFLFCLSLSFSFNKLLAYLA